MVNEAFKLWDGTGREVGYRVLGSPTEQDKRDALREFLDLYGDEVTVWAEVPKIMAVPATVTVKDFGRGPLYVADAEWAIYGILNEEPEETKYNLTEGVRMMFK